MLQVEVPTTILRGEPTMPLLVSATERLAAAMPQAELVVVPESRDHSRYSEKKAVELMKTMTCKQLGGPCVFRFAKTGVGECQGEQEQRHCREEAGRQTPWRGASSK